jgi:hypothetical protein
MNRPPRPQLGWWAQLTFWGIAAMVVYGDLSRLENPTGEKSVPLFGSGQLDFSYTYLGARALIAGVNPYHNDKPEFIHPNFPPETTGGWKQLYPPGNLLAHVPLALWKGADWQAAGQVWFRLSLVGLLLLAILAWALAQRVIEESLTPLWIPLFFICLAFNTGVELGLERGQSDILVAVVAWCAVFFFLRERYAASTFLSLWSVSMKGYAILLAVGLVLLALQRRRWKPVALGGALAVVIFVLPVARYMGEAVKAVRARADMFWAVWYNHSFTNAVAYWFPAWAPRGRIVLLVLALATSAATWIGVKRAFARGRRGDTALWTIAFAAASLGTMIGYSGLSISYNLIMLLPGVLILVATQDRLGRSIAMPGWAQPVLGLALLSSGFLLFRYRLGGDGIPGYGSGAPASAFGLVLVIATLFAVCVRAFVSARKADATGAIDSVETRH